MHDLGQYIDRDSPLHNSDPRVKLAAVLALSLLILRIDFSGIILVVLFLLAACLGASITPIELLRTTRPVWPFFVVLFLIYMLTTPGTSLLPSSWPVTISHEGLMMGTEQILRFFLLTLSASLLTMTTSLTHLTMGLEYLLRPLTLIKISSHDVALMVSMALRFIPLLQQELQQIREASAARGADFRCGGLRAKMRLMIYLAIPLTLGVMQRSDELVEAMEARGYQPGCRTYLNELCFKRSDYFSLALVAVFVIVLLLFR